MKIFRRNNKDLSQITPEEADKKIIETETKLTLLEKERDRKKKEFDDLFKEGANTSGSRRANIAQELSRKERMIQDLDKNMKMYREDIDIYEEIKWAKTQINDPSRDVIANTDPNKITNIMIEKRSREAVNGKKRGEMLRSISDVRATDDATSEDENKFLKIFKEMDKSKENLSPNAENKTAHTEDSEKTEENKE